MQPRFGGRENSPGREYRVRRWHQPEASRGVSDVPFPVNEGQAVRRDRSALIVDGLPTGRRGRLLREALTV